MLPFGRCLILWRLERGLSQSALAAKARLPRPNLSDIERGKREVSLRTLRSLALALDINPGTLADGAPPGAAEAPSGLSREAMERIARAVARGEDLQDPGEKELAGKMALLLRPRLTAQGVGPSSTTRKGLSAQRAWLSVAGTHPAPVVESLSQRIVERASARPTRKGSR